MFKKVSGSPICQITATMYIFGKDIDLYEKWVTDNGNQERNLAKIRIGPLGRNIIFCLTSGTTEDTDLCVALNNSLDTRDGTFLDLGFTRTTQLFATTADGSPLEEVERKTIADNAKIFFEHYANSIGALYLVLSIDGEDVYYFNDTSYYRYSSEKPEKDVATIVFERFKRYGATSDEIKQATRDAMADLMTRVKKEELPPGMTEEERDELIKSVGEFFIDLADKKA